MYGPDQGLVSERAICIISNLVDDPSDPFSVALTTTDKVFKNPSYLHDALQSPTLWGNKQVLHIKDGSDSIAKMLDDTLHNKPDNFVVIESENLSPRSKLRKVCETSPDAASISCFADDHKSLFRLITQQLSESNLTISPDALRYLAERLGENRAVSRNQIEKLSLYKNVGEIKIEDIAEIIDDTAGVSLNECIFYIFSGKVKSALKILNVISQNSFSFVNLVRAAQTHASRIHIAKSQLSAGASIDQALNQLHPPVFFKFRDLFIKQIHNWDETRLYYAMTQLIKAEIDIKTAILPSKEICERTMMRLASYAARFSK